MSVVLVNGDGNPAVHASQDADLLGGIGGQETGILDINDKFAATIADANTVEISSGVCITKEGRRIQIDVGDVEEVTVPTGSQGTTKYYIIGFHLYTDGSGNQLAETFIDEVESSTATITEKMFKDGETEVYVSLYRITRNGLNLEGLTLILPEIGSLAGGGIIGDTDISDIADGTLTGAVAQINTDLSELKRGSVSATIESSDTFKSAIEKIINLVDITKITPKTILKIGAFCYHVGSKHVDSSSTYQIDFQSIVYPGSFIVYEARFRNGNGWFYIDGVDKSSSTVRSESLYSTADEISLYY